MKQVNELTILRKRKQIIFTKNASSNDMGQKLGSYSLKTSLTTLLTSVYLAKLRGTITSSGQSFFAMNPGMKVIERFAQS